VTRFREQLGITVELQGIDPNTLTMWEEGGGHRNGWGVDAMPDPPLQSLDDAAGSAGLLISPADERVLEEIHSSHQAQMRQVQCSCPFRLQCPVHKLDEHARRRDGSTGAVRITSVYQAAAFEQRLRSELAALEGANTHDILEGQRDAKKVASPSTLNHFGNGFDSDPAVD
jgi:hypothetical protein